MITRTFGIFAAVFALFYTLAFEFHWELFSYHPREGRFGWLQQASTGLYVVYTDLHTLVDDDLIARDVRGTDRTLVVKFSKMFDLLD